MGQKEAKCKVKSTSKRNSEVSQTDDESKQLKTHHICPSTQAPIRSLLTSHFHLTERNMKLKMYRPSALQMIEGTYCRLPPHGISTRFQTCTYFKAPAFILNGCCTLKSLCILPNIPRTFGSFNGLGFIKACAFPLPCHQFKIEF